MIRGLVNERSMMFSGVRQKELTSSLLATLTLRPDLTFVVNMVCQHMLSLAVAHLQLVKHVLRCTKGTLELGVRIL